MLSIALREINCRMEFLTNKRTFISLLAAVRLHLKQTSESGVYEKTSSSLPGRHLWTAPDLFLASEKAVIVEVAVIHNFRHQTLSTSESDYMLGV